MKKFIATFALIGLLTASYPGLQAEKPMVKLTEKDHKKISQRVLGDMKKAKALKNLNRILDLVAIGSLAVASFARIDGPDTINKWKLTSAMPDCVKETLEQIKDNKRNFTKWSLYTAATSTVLSIPIRLKRMNKEGYYVGFNPFKLVYNMTKFNIVDTLA